MKFDPKELNDPVHARKIAFFAGQDADQLLDWANKNSRPGDDQSPDEIARITDCIQQLAKAPGGLMAERTDSKLQKQIDVAINTAVNRQHKELDSMKKMVKTTDPLVEPGSLLAAHIHRAAHSIYTDASRTADACDAIIQVSQDLFEPIQNDADKLTANLIDGRHQLAGIKLKEQE